MNNDILNFSLLIGILCRNANISDIFMPKQLHKICIQVRIQIQRIYIQKYTYAVKMEVICISQCRVTHYKHNSVFCLPTDMILWTYWYFIHFVENKSTKTQPIHKTHFTPHHGGSFETKVGGKWNNVSSQRMSWVGSKCDVMCNMMQDKIINKAFHYISFPPK